VEAISKCFILLSCFLSPPSSLNWSFFLSPFFARYFHDRICTRFPFTIYSPCNSNFRVVLMVQDHFHCRIIVSDILSSALCILFPPICYRLLSNFLHIVFYFFTYTGTHWISHTHSHIHSHIQTSNTSLSVASTHHRITSFLSLQLFQFYNHTSCIRLWN
jgi:hypothetical protein